MRQASSICRAKHITGAAAATHGEDHQSPQDSGRILTFSSALDRSGMDSLWLALALKGSTPAAAEDAAALAAFKRLAAALARGLAQDKRVELQHEGYAGISLVRPIPEHEELFLLPYTYPHAWRWAAGLRPVAEAGTG